MRLRQGLVRGGIAQKAPPRKKKGQTSKRPRREIRYLRPPGSLRHRPTWHLIELSRPIVALHFPPVGASHIGGTTLYAQIFVNANYINSTATNHYRD